MCICFREKNKFSQKGSNRSTLLVCIDGRQKKGGMNNNRVAIVPKTWREKSKMLVA